MKRIIDVMLLIGSLGLLVVALFFAWSPQTHFLFGYRPFVVTSGSMAPEFPVNSVVVIRKTDEIKVNDPVAFYSDAIHGNVLHRVVQITDQGYVTKGDNNPVTDSQLVPFEAAYGTVALSLPQLRGLVTLIRSNGKSVAVMIISLVLLFFSVSARKRRNKE